MATCGCKAGEAMGASEGQKAAHTGVREGEHAHLEVSAGGAEHAARQGDPRGGAKSRLQLCATWLVSVCLGPWMATKLVQVCAI